MTGLHFHFTEHLITIFDFDNYTIRTENIKLSEQVTYDQLIRRERDSLFWFLEDCLMIQYLYKKDPLKYSFVYQYYRSVYLMLFG